MQGQLQGEDLTCHIESECGHCGRGLHFEFDAALNYRLQEEEAEPLVFVPMVDFDKLEDPSIIDAF